MTSATAPLDVVLPAPEHVAPDPAEERLAALYSPAWGTAGRHVRVNMVSTVDGGAWGPDHLSGSINDEADWRVFRVLRALADVVLIGAGTARLEGYTALERPGGITAGPDDRAARLELVLVTRSGRVPTALADADRPPLVVTGAAGAQVAGDALPADRVIAAPAPGDPESVDLAAGLDALTDRGLRRVLCEGGPHLLEAMLRADLVDELCVTTSPCLVGAGPGRIVAASVPGLPATPARPARLAHLLHAPATGTLLARWDLHDPVR
ncbi:dihydrofolate reductase family protein [Isoptericola hypogeus]|uniref:dihydrofolate reductase family protein n=1 Tax=Isoptericola hypogeus TaxID=300179 RepID=UPI0031E31CDD